MKTRSRYRAYALIGLGVAAAIGIVAFAVKAERQQFLNRSLIAGIKSGDVTALSQWLNQGASANAIDLPDTGKGIQALVADIWSLLRGQSPVQSSSRNSALLAVYHRMLFPDPKVNSAMERLLLEHGANPDAGDDSGGTLLQYASHDNDVEIVKLLLEHGAHVDGRGGGGGTPLFGASVDCARILIDHGANVNAVGDDGMTPLMVAFAQRTDSIQKADLLLRHGADLNAKDKDGRSPLMWATLWNHMEVWPEKREDHFRFLVGRGANVNSADNLGRTVLIYAIRSCSDDIVSLLLRHGARVTNQDQDGMTALDWARIRSDKLKRLLKAKAQTERTHQATN